jgi:hypothetical protein
LIPLTKNSCFRHQFLIKGKLKIRIPNPHRSNIWPSLLRKSSGRGASLRKTGTNYNSRRRRGRLFCFFPAAGGTKKQIILSILQILSTSFPLFHHSPPGIPSRSCFHLPSHPFGACTVGDVPYLPRNIVPFRACQFKNPLFAPRKTDIGLFYRAIFSILSQKSISSSGPTPQPDPDPRQ